MFLKFPYLMLYISGPIVLERYDLCSDIKPLELNKIFK